jgi:BirA family transcriptional regulator, biotin operon repressor / biotin---[acetyl-CoA-carboxylase] ligase
LVAAVAVVQALAECQVPASIKWPNDIEVDGKKIAGILTELSADVEQVHFVVVGIGVNLNTLLEDFPLDLRATATSARLVRGERIHRALFVAHLFEALESWLDVWSIEGFEPVREAWKSHSQLLGKTVRVKNDGREVLGVAEDIDERGALLLRVDGVLQTILAGDVEQVRARS